MSLFLIGLVLFFATHLFRVVAPDARQSLIDRFGKGAYQGLYSIASLATLALLIFGYGKARLDPVVIWQPPVWMPHLTSLLMLLALIALSAYLLPAGHIAARLKHPMLVSIKTWALAHLLANGTLNDILLFGSFLAWAVVLRIFEARRERAGLSAPRSFVSAKWDLAAVALGIVLTVLIIARLHLWLIGVQPIAMH